MDLLQTFTVLTDPTWLADAAVRSAALLAGAGLLATGAHRAPAAVRHLIWAVALATSLALPAVSGRMPSITMVVPESLASLVARPASVIDPPSAATAPPRTPPPPEHADSTATPRVEPTGSPIGSTTRPAASPLDWPTALLLLWSAGALFVMLRFTVGLGTAWCMSRAAATIDDPSWRHLANDLSDRLGLARTVRLLRSERANVPMTWGWSRPVVLLPADADDWPVECRTAVLAHELAHVQRRDCAIQAVAQLACAVYWFNPLVWLAARRLRVERERACDDQVLTMGMRPSDYAKHLLNIAHSQPMEWAAAATMAMARRSELEGRLMAILDPEARRVIPRAVRILTVSTVVILALALAAVEPSGYAPQSDRAADPAGPMPGPTGAGQDPVSDDDTETPEPGERVVQAFISAMADPDASVRRQAARALGRVRGERALDALARALGADSDADVRSAAARALGRARRSEAAAALAGALDDADAEVRRQAAWALGNIRSREAVQALVAALRDTDPEVQDQAAWALGNIRDPAAMDGLRDALRNAGDGARRQAAWALGNIRSREAVSALAGALDDEDPDVQQQAAWALGNIRDASAVDGLVAALRSAADDARQQAAWALGNIRAERAVDGLVAALRDTDGDVQQQAAWALGNIRDARAVDGLVEALGSAADDAREQAAWALGRLRDARAIDGLAAALTDDEEDVREQAAWALGQDARFAGHGRAGGRARRCRRRCPPDDHPGVGSLRRTEPEPESQPESQSPALTRVPIHQKAPARSPMRRPGERH